MLYIKNYTKFDLDKSSESIYKYYNGQFAELNDSIDDIRAYLSNMLIEIGDLRVDLQNIKNTVQESLDDTKDAYNKAGLSNPALDKVQEILDKSEEDLSDLENRIENTIETIDCNEEITCNECNYTADCAEVENNDDCNETPATPTNPFENVEPIYTCTFDENNCNYCTYGAGEGNNVWVQGDDICYVCKHGDSGLMQDMTCNEPYDTAGGLNPVCNEAGRPCAYNYESIAGCENPTGCEFGQDANCTMIVCTANLNDEVDKLPGGTPITCNVSSACQEVSIPADCIFNDTSTTVCNYDSSGCVYNSDACAESTCAGNDDALCAFIESGCNYTGTVDCGECNYDSTSGFDFSCSQFVDLTEEEAHCNNYCSYDSDCSEGGCNYDPKTDGVVCEAGDDYDPSCDKFSDDDDDDDDSNVICTYIIERLFNNELKDYYKQISRENIILGFKGGLNKKILREYKYGLGPIIIDYLKKESNDYINKLWNENVIPIWIDLRRNPRVGYKKYIQFVIKMIDRYKVKITKFETLNNLYSEER